MGSVRAGKSASGAIAAIAVVAAVVLAYANSLGGALLLDDESSITRNPSIRQLWPLVAPPAGAVTGGRPVANFSFAVDYAVSGTRVWSYHVTNLIVHALAALALFGVVRRTLELPRWRERWSAVAVPLAASVAGLWALHPVQTEAVDYLSQRTEQLMGLCYLLTLYCFIRGTRTSPRMWYLLAVAACALGMACKEVMVTAPVLVLLFDRTFIAGSWRAAWQVRKRIYAGLAATWALLAYLVAGSHLDLRGAGFNLGVGWVQYALTETRAVLWYLRLAVWPSPLVFDYGWDYLGGWAEAAPYVFGWGSLVGGTLWALWRWPRLGFFGCAFLLILAPSSSVVPVGAQPMAESRLYLPLAAVVTLGVIALNRVSRRYCYVAVGLIGLAEGVTTLRRNAEYREALTLWTDTVAKQPRNARAWKKLGETWREQGRATEAIRSFEEAVRLKPDFAEGHYDLGTQWATAGDYARSIPEFERAIALSPRYADAQINLGNVLLATGRTQQAVVHYQVAVECVPGSALAHFDLAVALSKINRLPAAIAEYQAAIRIDPGLAEAHLNLGEVFAAVGRPKDALAEFDWAVKSKPTLVAARMELGNACVAAGKLSEAEIQYREMVRLAPDNAEAWNNLGVVLMRAGHPAEALAQFRQALVLRPTYADAENNLTLARRKLGQ